ncbi:MAG TPA: hypothetical protein VGP72_11750 [Planctomycetota bacterium]|jgi:hypothetical protein
MNTIQPEPRSFNSAPSPRSLHSLRLCVEFAALFSLASLAHAECKVTESRRNFEGAERPIVTLENDRIVVEIAPDMAGKIFRYKEKNKNTTPFEWLDDCPYHYGGRWEGKPFTHMIGDKGPEKASVTVKGGGKVAVALLRSLGVNVTGPLDLAIERTVSIEPNSTRLRVDVKITNTGDSVAPSFRYMVHAVYGQVPRDPLHWFLTTKNGIEVFDMKRGQDEMGASAGSGGAPVNHPFSRFTPGVKADKPRYEAAGWGALLTSVGPAFIYYDPAQYDFMQFWVGGDSEWHYTYEPHSKPVDLKPGDSVSCGFTLAYDAKDVPFTGEVLAYRAPSVPEEAIPGSNIVLKAQATTVKDSAQVAVNFEVKDPQGKVILSKEAAGEVQQFKFTDLAAEVPLPADAALGKYAWAAKLKDGKPLGSGTLTLMTVTQVEQAKMARATKELRDKLDETTRKAQKKEHEARLVNDLWRDGVNMALTMDDPRIWPGNGQEAGANVSVIVQRGRIPVLGLWQEREDMRLQKLAAGTAAVWPNEPAKILDALKEQRALVRDVTPDKDGKGLVALVVNPQQKRTEVMRISAPAGRDAGPTIGKRFGRFSEKPTEIDETLGTGARAVLVDGDGNIWVATNAWGDTSVFKTNQDGSPYEESVVADKGALKKFSPDGALLGTVSMLDTPMDLVLAEANGTPVILAPYRNVSSYHGAQVREGVMLVRLSDARRVGEIKVPTGSISVDEQNRLWAADVAGHVSCHEFKGKKLFDVAGSPAPAVPDAKLPPGSPLPAMVRCDGRGTTWILYALQHKLAACDASGKAVGEPKVAPEGIDGVLALEQAVGAKK